MNEPNEHILDWYENTDHLDRPCVEAGGGSTDGDSCDLHYRIRKVRRSGRAAYLEYSSPELMRNENRPRVWKTLAGAKRAMQRDYEETMCSYIADKRRAKTARVSRVTEAR